MIFDETGEVEQAYLKVMIYAGPGNGKTYTALKIATALGKTLMIDTERGSEPYRKRFFDPDGKPFVVTRTRDAKAIIKEAIPWAEKNGCKCLILDQASTVWEDCQHNYMMREFKKQSKAWKFIEKNGKIPFQGWSFIKGPYKKMVRAFLTTPLHVFILTRLAVDFQVSSSGEPIPVGDKPVTEKETPYEPAVLIKMSHEKKSGIWLAECEKDRWGCIEGQSFENPDISMFKDIIPLLGEKHGAYPEPVEDMPEEGEIEEGDTLGVAQIHLLLSIAAKNGLDEGKFKEYIDGISSNSASKLIKEMTLGKMPSL